MPDNMFGKSRSKAPPYKHQSWPKMMYHPTEHGVYVVCASKKEVPAGYIEDHSFVGLSKAEATALRAARAKDLKEEADKVAEERGDDVEGENPLAALGIDRDEAITFLKESKVKHRKDATDQELADLVEKADEDGDSE